jgi:hypothetical protein
MLLFGRRVSSAALLMGVAWVINLAMAEWASRLRLAQPVQYI